MKDQVPEPVKAKRSEELIEIGRKLRKTYLEEFIGKKNLLLVEEKEEIEGKEYFVGHTGEYIKAGVASGENLVGKMVRIYPKEIIKGEILLAELNYIY
jgi:threonylcarbamoyladenosine tRNA methylthiotransferase MtaB